MLGRLYRERGLTLRATREFSRVLEIAPGHPEAARELKELSATAGPTPRFQLAFASR
jgi:hypothetical protein